LSHPEQQAATPRRPTPSVECFSVTQLGALGRKVFRLGFSATYRPGRETVHEALDAGIQVFFAYGFDTQLIRVLREIPPHRRQQLVIVTGAYNLLWGHPHLRRTLEKRLRQFRTDYLDCFILLGVMGKEKFLDRALEEMDRFRQEGKIRAGGVSIHARQLAGELVRRGKVQALMLRYNAAHRGAEQDIFPHLALHNPAVISYTATRWTALLRRPRGWPQDGRIPTPGLCYRFALSDPRVHVCLTAPSNRAQFKENLTAMREGPLDEEEMAFMRQFGDAVHARQTWFM
jgi:aryl-alcohol dehydrogenase-like predicted oxidoreductase